MTLSRYAVRYLMEMERLAGAWCSVVVGLVVTLASAEASAQLLDRASRATRGSDSDGGRASSGSSGGGRDRDRDDDGGRDRDRDRDHDRGDRSSSGGGYHYRGGRRGYDRSVVYVGGSGYSSGSSYVASSSSYGGAGCVGCGLSVSGAGRPYDEHWYEDRTGRLGLRLEGEGGYAIAGAARAAVGIRAEIAFFHLFARYAGFLDPGGEDVRGALFGRVGVEFAMLSIPEAQLRIGGAVRHWHDSFGSVAGFDLGLSADLFPGDPFVVTLETAAGMVGQAFSVLARAEIGVMVDSTEIFATYNYESLIGEDTYADLGGLMLGIRAWL